MSKLSPAWQWLCLLLVSVPLSAFFEWVQLPGSQLLGPALAGTLLALNGARLQLPRPLFIAAQAMIGCVIAQAVMPSVFLSVAQDWVTMLLVVGATVAAGGMVGWTLARFGSLPGSTAAWGSSPGGASAMVVMAEEYGADVQLVAFMQYLRVMMVVLAGAVVARMLGQSPADPASVLPPWTWPGIATAAVVAVIGAVVGRRLRLPAGGLLGPLALGVAVHAGGIGQITVPFWPREITYGLIGWYIGLGFTREVVGYAFRAIPQLILSTSLLMGLCLVSAWVLTWRLHTDWLSAYLATSPGGLDSMAIIAMGSHADIAIILAVQTLRLLLVVVTGPALAKMICRHIAPRRPLR